MFAIFSYLWYMMSPVQDLLSVQYSWFAAKGALGRVNGLLRLRDEPTYPRLEDPFRHQMTASIVVDDLRFAYGHGPDVLRGVNVAIASGEKVGLVGASGGGKSTFVQALLGLYPFSSGDLLFNGVPVSRIGWDIVRENIVTVLQHPALFNDTVRANLTLGGEYQDAELWRALEIAQLASDVAQMEHGLESQVGRQGARMSGGQRQRLAIARLVLVNPKVLILDEATSGLDVETEERLYQELLAAFPDRTLLMVAHRLSTLRFVDRVLVFEDGRIAEEGSHADLLGSGGLYAELYGKQ
jgi:ATP-binding cassette subfamily C protein